MSWYCQLCRMQTGDIDTHQSLYHDPKVEMTDNVNSPQHYTDVVPGIEAIQVTENFNFNLGNAIKYIWRSSRKGREIEDLKKAAWYINREVARLEKAFHA